MRQAGARPYTAPDGRDLAFVVREDPAMVDEAWDAWRREADNTTRVLSGVDDLGDLAASEPTPIREVVVHMLREYAQHLGHADLLRERIDGRVGQ